MNKFNSLILLAIITVSISSCVYQLIGSIDIAGLENVTIIAGNSNVTKILEQK